MGEFTNDFTSVIYVAALVIQAGALLVMKSHDKIYSLSLEYLFSSNLSFLYKHSVEMVSQQWGMKPWTNKCDNMFVEVQEHASAIKT